MTEAAQQLRERVQNDIAKIITAQLEAGSLSEHRAKEIASLVLEKLPQNLTYQQLIEVIPTLDDHFEELATVVVPIMKEYESKLKSAVDVKLKELINQGKMDELLDLTRKAIEAEKKLS